jgi:glycosyltransferase involved in cell wall biosynthesis
MRILVVADISINQVDGSTIWMKNMIKLLSLSDRGMNIVVLAREQKSNQSPIVRDIEAISNVTILEPFDCLGKAVASAVITQDNLLDAISGARARCGTFDFILCRGAAFAARLAAHPEVRRRLIVYWTGISQILLDGGEPLLDVLARDNVKIIAQTHFVKNALEVFAGVFSGNIAVVPPMIETASFQPGLMPTSSRDQVLSYSGKIDKDYLVLDLLKLAGCELPEGRRLKVDFIAGKLTKHKEDRNFPADWEAARRAADPANVTFSDNVPHSEIAPLMQRGSFAWCVRSPRYDSIVEISTKMLEYAALGVPPIINRTPINEAVFGKDYPLFVERPDQALDLVRRLSLMTEEERHELTESCRNIAARFDMALSIPTMRRFLNLDVRQIAGGVSGQMKLLVAGHDLKFLDRIIHRLRSVPSIELSFDRWRTSQVPEVDRQAFAHHADVVFCEWCCENAVWHSRNKRPGSRLIVRLHRFEAFRDFPARVDWRNVDQLIVVSDHFRNICVEQFGVTPEIITVFPQFIEASELDRPKHQRAARTIGMVGINPYHHKRFDRALEFMKRLVSLDSSMMLRVRSAMPWDIGWVWESNGGERRLYENLFGELMSDPELSDRVIFDRPGRDMEEWYREVGFILSSSDSEGCHTSVLEGMASGCVPLVFSWPGAKSLFPSQFVYDELTCAADDVVRIASSGQLPAVGKDMKAWVSGFDTDAFLVKLLEMIFGEGEIDVSGV